ncbi:hypothetical protein WHR41_09618, partial [Cladosporium halotolerans]
MPAERRTSYSISSSTEGNEDIPLVCEGADCMGSPSPLWYCAKCYCTYCDDCWKQQVPHRPGKGDRDRTPHEQVHPMVARKIGSVFDTTNASDVVKRLHEKDKTSKWFGVVRDRYGRPVLEDYGRYEILCAAGAGRRDSAPLQFPRLVSFIGVTNAGKSTLIKLLISLADAEHGRRAFPSPVAG